MQNFEYCNPVRIIFGHGQISAMGAHIPKDARILLAYGGGSIKRNGCYDQVQEVLSTFSFVEEFSGIKPNPEYDMLMQGVQIIKQKNIDFILAVGGGSVIDGAKFMAAAAYFEGDPWDIFAKQAAVARAIPLGCVLTLPATGSEMNGGSVVTRASLKAKMAFQSEAVYPRFSVLDPCLTESLPDRQVANGIVDAYTHTVEQYLNESTEARLQDRLAESILQTLIEVGPKTLAEPSDYAARSNFMWCATMALNGLIGKGVSHDWTTHTIGHQITALYGLDHAQTLAIVLPAVMMVKRASRRDKLLQYAERVFGLSVNEPEAAILAAIDNTRAFFQSLGVGCYFSDYGIDPSTAPAEIMQNLHDHASFPLGAMRDVSEADAEAILKIAAGETCAV